VVATVDSTGRPNHDVPSPSAISGWPATRVVVVVALSNVTPYGVPVFVAPVVWEATLAKFDPSIVCAATES
jgi:hypothetical protein